MIRYKFQSWVLLFSDLSTLGTTGMIPQIFYFACSCFSELPANASSSRDLAEDEVRSVVGSVHSDLITSFVDHHSVASRTSRHSDSSRVNIPPPRSLGQAGVPLTVAALK